MKSLFAFYFSWQKSGRNLSVSLVFVGLPFEGLTKMITKIITTQMDKDGMEKQTAASKQPKSQREKETTLDNFLLT